MNAFFLFWCVGLPCSSDVRTRGRGGGRRASVTRPRLASHWHPPCLPQLKGGLGEVVLDSRPRDMLFLFSQSENNTWFVGCENISTAACVCFVCFPSLARTKQPVRFRACISLMFSGAAVVVVSDLSAEMIGGGEEPPVVQHRQPVYCFFLSPREREKRVHIIGEALCI